MSDKQRAGQNDLEPTPSEKTKDDELLQKLLSSIRQHSHYEKDEAHVEIHGNRVIRSHLVEGLTIDAQEAEDGIDIDLRVQEGIKIPKPVSLCFGMIPENGKQHIRMKVTIGDGAEVNFTAHCTFPNAKKVEHRMDAEIEVGRDARYTYFERHVHGPGGGVEVIPKAKIHVKEGGRFTTEFELLEGRVGLMDIDYDTRVEDRGVMEMTARISGRGDDVIKIREAAQLAGEYSRGVLTSNIALRDDAKAEIYNDLKAQAAYARGHVDCNEIVQDRGVARAVPIVEASHPKAHVTHEAAIGSVDSKQLQTLMSRGLSEAEAVEMIIRGLLA